MDKSTLNKLKNIEERFFEIEKLMADQNNASDIKMITKLAKEHSEIKKVVNLLKILRFMFITSNENDSHLKMRMIIIYFLKKSNRIHI